MKVKHIIVLFLFTYIIDGIGLIFKIQHWPGGGVVFVVSGLLKLIPITFAIWKVLTIDKFKEFLNS